MAACYHPDITFHDPVFGTLRGRRAKDMWRMLCKIGKDLTVSASNITADDQTGSAHWVADYTFSTGRKIHNEVDASFEFRDGLIVTHNDNFDFRSWCGQAFGPVGSISAHTPIPGFVLRRLVHRQLDVFQRRIN